MACGGEEALYDELMLRISKLESDVARLETENKFLWQVLSVCGIAEEKEDVQKKE